MAIRFLAAILSLIDFVGCAGPMSPFGALPLSRGTAIDESRVPAAVNSRTLVRFLPERQVLHGPSTFAVVIDDPDGVPETYKLNVNYNGMDVTKTFLAHATVTPMDPLNRELKLSTPSFRLLPTRDNRISVWYSRDGVQKTAAAQYMPPSCSAFVGNQMLFTVPDFDPPLAVLQLINVNAQRKNLNPYFVAALVAQESSFDPLALSRSKALGLTQVTSLGESEIIKRVSGWPRYPGIEELPLPLLKASIVTGRIHSGNEWRLDPARSIEGGVEYLSYLSEYWSRPEKRAVVERNLGPGDGAVSEVMLASYNSGAARVSEALERSGAAWLQAEELGEARKYVRRVVSYCDHFQHRDDYAP